MVENDFISLRNKYMPQNIKVIFILESPPNGHGYVYDPRGHTGEVLFRAFMRLLNVKPPNKEMGLRILQDRGILLINPTYKALNKLPDKEADKIIIEGLDSFVADLRALMKKMDTPIILVKSNICRLLEKPLETKGFNVLNRGIMIPFPIHYHQESFYKKCSKLLQENKIKL